MENLSKTVMLSAGVSDYCQILRLKSYAWYKVHYPYDDTYALCASSLYSL